ncbi:hypothetical protein M0805_003437 [Coniferiporia weirii]|nr:hypothetical protein M0805_003437 [Coniferiporia weirii]
MEGTVKNCSGELANKSYQSTVLKLDETIRNLRFINDDLNRQLYTLNNRSQNAAEKLGFTSFENLEEALLNRSGIWNVDITQHSQGTKTKKDDLPIPRVPEEGSGSDDIILRREFEQLKSEVRMLQQRASLTHVGDEEADGGPENDSDSRSPAKNPSFTTFVSSKNPEDPDLRSKFDALARKYDALLAEKEYTERKYKEDYKKWKSLKLWLFNKSKHRKVSYARADGKSRRSSLRTEDAFTVEDYDSLASTDDEGACLAFPRKAPSSPLRTSIRSRKAKEGDPNETIPGDPLLRKRAASRSDSPTSTSGRHEESQFKPPNVSKLDIVPGTSAQERVCKDRVKVGNLTEAESTRTPVKRRGRYSDVTSGDAINALFEIDSSKNDGLAFQFDEIVRGRRQRQKLDAGDCDCCKNYYDHIATLPDPVLPPVWKSPIANQILEDPHRGIGEIHKKRISRHRHQWAPPTTPPGYWNIGFPTTQEAADINKKAEDIHANKRRRVETEADAGNGRFIRRNNVD